MRRVAVGNFAGARKLAGQFLSAGGLNRASLAECEKRCVLNTDGGSPVEIGAVIDYVTAQQYGTDVPTLTVRQGVDMRSEKKLGRRGPERMSDFSFRGMELLFRVIDFAYPYVDRRVQRFGIQPGMTVVDYGCGPGRYTTRFAHFVGERGSVFAVDIHELAIEGVKKRIEKQQLKQVTPVLAKVYDSGLPDGIADMICAIDVFFAIKDPTAFLKELRRITRPEGLLIIDDGHQSRTETKRKIAASGCWEIAEESKDHLKCKPLSLE